MNRKTIQAFQVKRGMVIVPPIRTMRHAFVEDLISSDAGVTSEKERIPTEMRNHAHTYVIFKTDIGPMSFRAYDPVDVLCIEGK